MIPSRLDRARSPARVTCPVVSALEAYRQSQIYNVERVVR